jgi:hypothetical protein
MQETRVLVEDLVLELTERRARLDAQLTDEQAPRLGVDGQRFGLP